MGLDSSHFRNVPDWPRDGIQFKDIGPVLGDPGLLSLAADSLVEEARSLMDSGAVDYVIAPEARGFLFGGSLAMSLSAGLIPARKPGKLPPDTISVTYELEYGVDGLHVPQGELEGATVLIHDDLLATGGTAAALAQLSEGLGAKVIGAVFLAELAGLGGRERLEGIPTASVVLFD